MMEQQTMKVKCPNHNCGAVMTIPDTPGIADRMLTCPICKRRDKVSLFMEEMNKPEEDSTEVCFSETNDSIGVLRVGNSTYPLTEGANFIGRKSLSSTADIQLIVDDLYMSRMHICISVTKKPEGYQHKIENLTTRNTVIVNGKEMKAGEVFILKYGETIRLGHTDIKFERL